LEREFFKREIKPPTYLLFVTVNPENVPPPKMVKRKFPNTPTSVSNPLTPV